MKKTTFLIAILSFAALCSAQNIRPMVKDVSASISTEKGQVLLTWAISEESVAQISELFVYRNVGSIVKTSTLSLLSPRATLNARDSSYIDEVSDYNAYYYAIVARTIDGYIYDVVIPTVNATNVPVAKTRAKEVITANTTTSNDRFKNATPTIDASVTAPLRERPLPYIDILSTDKAEAVATITNETLEITQLEANESIHSAYLQPSILEKDTNGERATGDDYTLYLIVSSDIMDSNWKQAQEKLLQFLQINRSTDATARANFYLAQTYYFQRDYRNALTYFQKSEKLYPIYSKQWIEESLNRFTIG